MGLTASDRSPLFVDSVYGSSTDKLLRGANVVFTDTDGAAVILDSLYLEVIDSDDDVLTLTSGTVPAIELLTGNSYSVDSIDVSGYPDGDITLKWVGTYDGYQYEHTQTVSYGSSDNIIILADSSSNVQDYRASIGAVKTLSVVLQDGNGVRFDGYGARIAIQDNDVVGSVVVRESASLVIPGSGLWQVEYDFSDPSLTPALDRYELFWEFQAVDGGAWAEVGGTRYRFELFGEITDVESGGLNYCSVQDIRIRYPLIDNYLSAVAQNQQHRDLVLQQAISDTSITINRKIESKPAKCERELLKLWCVWETIRRVLSLGASFASFKAKDQQMKFINSEINRIRIAIFGSTNFMGTGTSRNVKEKNDISRLP